MTAAVHASLIQHCDKFTDTTGVRTFKNCEQVLAEVRDIQHKKLAVELLRKLLYAHPTNSYATQGLLVDNRCARSPCWQPYVRTKNRLLHAVGGYGHDALAEPAGVEVCDIGQGLRDGEADGLCRCV